MIREAFKPPKNGAERVKTDYHVLLSPTWRVPVLYFSTQWMETLTPLTLNEIYEFIVEDSSRNVIDEVGIMGGISHGVYS